MLNMWIVWCCWLWLFLQHLCFDKNDCCVNTISHRSLTFCDSQCETVCHVLCTTMACHWTRSSGWMRYWWTTSVTIVAFLPFHCPVHMTRLTYLPSSVSGDLCIMSRSCFECLFFLPASLYAEHVDSFWFVFVSCRVKECWLVEVTICKTDSTLSGSVVFL